MAQFTVSGTVSEKDGDPLIGATVLVKNTTIGIITDIDGNYSLEVPGESATLVVSMIGFAEQQFEVNGTSTLDIDLVESTTNLDEVVVTGLATTVKRSNLANSVAQISAKELAGIATQSTMDGALYGKFKGANLNSNSGAPGGGMSVRLRGLTSINGNNQPLYIIDGVYIDNSTIPAQLNVVSAAGAGGSTVSQDNPTNRIADIDPEDIETIEILKGASAAAIYGSRASGGVIIINTKKGKKGKTTVKLSQSIGTTWQLNKLGTREWDVEKIKAAFGTEADPDATPHVAKFQEAQANGTLRNYEDELFGNKGLLSTSRLSVGGGNAKTQFVAGITYKNDEGIVKNTGYEKTSLRLNVDHKLNRWLNISVTNNYINSTSDRGFFNNDNSGTTMGVSFVNTPSWEQLLPDSEGNYPNNTYVSSNFLQTRDLITNREDVNRFITGGKITAKLLTKEKSTLQLIVRGGVDNYTLRTTAIFPRTLQFMQADNSLQGASVQGTTSNTNTNLAAFLVQKNYSDNGLSFTTQLGVTRETFDRNTIVGTATGLNGSQTNLDQSTNRDLFQDRRIQEDRGFFVQEEVNYDEKVIVTVGLRGDKSTNNGDVNKLYYYPKAAAAINIHEFTELGPLSRLKLRVAYGESGNFALFGSKFTSLNGGILDGQSGFEINPLLGNEEVGPERQKELEFGTDIGLLKDKVSIDATYYIKSVEDLLLNANVPTSSGFVQKVTNAAELENKGIELGLNVTPVNRKMLRWDARVGFWLNRSKVTRLEIPAFITGAFGATLGTFYIEEGSSATQIVGIGSGDNANAGGFYVYGDSEPDFNMSFMNNLNIKGVDVNFLFHWKKGGDNINLSTLLTDIYGTSPDYDDKGLDPSGELTNGNYRLSQLGASAEPFVEDAGYFRLREIALSYNLPRSIFKDAFDLRVGVSGRNLLNWFSYNSYDPEVSNFGGNGLSGGVEVTPFPSAKQINFRIEATF